MPEPTTYSRNELSDMFGCSPSTMTKWTRIRSFPKPDREGRFTAVAVAEWWFQNRAPKARRMKLVHGVEELATELSLGDQDKQLDLQLKAHKVSKAIGDAVSFEDIRNIIGDLAADIREACGSAQKATGQDLTPIFDESFEKFERRLMTEQQKLSES